MLTLMYVPLRRPESEFVTTPGNPAQVLAPLARGGTPTGLASTSVIFFCAGNDK